MRAKRIMFFIHLRTKDDLRKWDELVDEHPGWKQQNIEVSHPQTIIIPNMTFECADEMDKLLKSKGLHRTWLKDNEPSYYEELKRIGRA